VKDSGAPDTDIIRKVLQGEQAVFALLVGRYQSYVFTLVLRLLQNREDAEEVAQDVFVKAYRSLKGFRGASKFSTWLFTIARTSSISFLRKKGLDTISLDQEGTGQQLANAESAFSANGIESRSRHQMVNRAMDKLSPDDGLVLTLFYSGEQSLEEIGKIMGLTSNTVKVKLHRARRRLREKMEKYFPEEVQDL